jgi:putative GTP pyrophosphokinase
VTVTDDVTPGDPRHDALSPLSDLDPALLSDLTALRTEFTRFMLQYQFGVNEMTTKIGILCEEFRLLHDYNPVEHVSSRLKSPESIIAKVARKNGDPSFEGIRRSITDIAGIRVTCSFSSDVYRLFDTLTGQSDLTVLRVKDYIKNPKANGYRSLHVLVAVPVFLSAEVVDVVVEIQFRTIAMDFWASLEHKIYYKYQRDVPGEVLDQLATAAETAHQLDSLMENLHLRVHANDLDIHVSDDRLVPTDATIEQFRSLRTRPRE